VLKTVNYDTNTERLVLGDLTIMFSSNFVLTVRHGEAMPLRSIRADLENHPSKLASGPTAVLHELVDRLVDQYVTVCAHLAEDVDQIEDSVFDDETPAAATQLYFVKRELIEFRRAVLPLVQPIDLIQTQQNADMRKISAWVGIGAVPTMVAGIYGMNFKYLPELEWRYGYFVVVGALVVVCGVLFRLFHKYNWL